MLIAAFKLMISSVVLEYIDFEKQDKLNEYANIDKLNQSCFPLKDRKTK